MLIRYLVGLPLFQLETDHTRLVPILMTKDLDTTPLRCHRMLMRMMRSNAKVFHRPGKELLIADALSIFPTNKQDSQIQEVVDSHIEYFEEDTSVTPDGLNKIRAATVHDSDLRQVVFYVLHKWPVKVPEHLMKFKREEGNFSVRNGLLIMNNRIVALESQEEEVINKLHQSHLGINKCRRMVAKTKLRTEEPCEQLQVVSRK